MSGKNIIRFFKDWDPLGFIVDGFPDDEYDLEAANLFWWFEKNDLASEREIAIKAYSIIADRILGEESKSLKRDALSRANEMREALIRDLQNEKDKK